MRLTHLMLIWKMTAFQLHFVTLIGIKFTINRGLQSMEQKMEDKIEKIRELVKEIKSYDDVLFMYEGDKIDLNIKKQELWELLQNL